MDSFRVPDKETLRTQLQDFGYSNIPEEVLDEFVADISKLYIGTPNSQSNTSTTSTGSSKKKKEPIYHREEETTTDQYSEEELYNSKRQTPSSSKKTTTTTTKTHSTISPHVRFEKENRDNQIPTANKPPLRFDKGKTSRPSTLRKNVATSSSSEYDTYTTDEYTSDAYTTDSSSRPTTVQSDTESVSSYDSRDSRDYEFGARARGAAPGVIYSRPSSARLVGIGLPCTGVRTFRKSDPVSLYHYRKKQWKNDAYLSNPKESGDRKKTVLVEMPANKLVLPPKKLIPSTKSNYSDHTVKRRDKLRFELRAKLQQ
eukprot:TRINITY_DN3926_c0_g1_i1.p1 TRINITY_DN3926_c0_g1~~TRINITY_DN3926_c0_g1_i1.p1  ORF type:complete len:314 (+),score=64.18 TRINITY_DN3926_c0_g1_i1:134-1075(+)